MLMVWYTIWLVELMFPITRLAAPECGVVALALMLAPRPPKTHSPWLANSKSPLVINWVWPKAFGSRADSRQTKTRIRALLIITVAFDNQQPVEFCSLSSDAV